MTLTKIATTTRRDRMELVTGSERERVAMGIDPAAMAHILDRLTDLYPRPIETTVRELVSNAYDATVLMPDDNRSSVRVLTPSALASEFVVEDFGVGMTTDTVRRIYSQYGTSTKAKDMSQTGAYGLGAKAPLAYCGEFHGETTRDGITTFFRVSRESLGNFTDIVDVRETHKRSGTRITVPALTRDAEAFRKAADVYARQAPDFACTVDGARHDKDYVLLLDDFLIHEESQTRGRVWVQRQDIPILVRGSLLSQPPSWSYVLSGWTYGSGAFGGSRGSVLVELKPGVVDFPTSRDAIVANDRASALGDLCRKQFADEKFRNALLRVHRGSSVQQANSVIGACVYNIVGLNDNELTFSNGPVAHRLSSFTLDRSQFITDEGYDPLAFFFPGEEKTVQATILMNYESVHLLRDKIPLLYNSQRDNLQYFNLTELRRQLRERLTKGEANYGVLTGVNKAINAFGASHKAVDKIYIFTDMDPIHSNAVMNWRVKLGSKMGLMIFMFVTSSPALQGQVTLLEKAGYNVELTTYEKMRQHVSSLQLLAAPRTRPASMVHELTPSFTTSDELRPGKRFAVDANTIRERRAVLVNAGSTNHERAALIGAQNDGIDIVGRPVYGLPKKGHVAASELAKLADYDGLIFATDYVGRSKTVETLAKNRTHHGWLLNATVEAMEVNDVIASYIGDIRASKTFTECVIAQLATLEQFAGLANHRITHSPPPSLAQLRKRAPEVADLLAKLQTKIDEFSDVSNYSIFAYTFRNVLSNERHSTRDRALVNFYVSELLKEIA